MPGDSQLSAGLASRPGLPEDSNKPATVCDLVLYQGVRAVAAHTDQLKRMPAGSGKFHDLFIGTFIGISQIVVWPLWVNG